MYKLVCPTCRGEIMDSDCVCPHCQQPLMPVGRSPRASGRWRKGDLAASFAAAKVFWVVFAIGVVMALVLGFPSWFFAVKPETQQMGLIKMGYGTGAALLFGFISFAVTRNHNQRD